MIHGYAELIPKESDAGKVSGYGDSIRRASDRMTAMLNSLLEFFRLDSGKEQLSVHPFRLSAVSDTLLRKFSPQAEAKGLRLSVENKADAILMGDRERIIQIGDNLLTNAVKFTQAGHISVMLSHSDGTLTIIVEDTGSGMTEDEQLRVFNAFERLSNAATQDGFGLGLSIVKSITDMMGGTIRLESEKRFRQDLFYRLREFVITVPPLRDCREDIMPLAEFFREIANRELERDIKGFNASARNALLAYPWPGNVRELKQKVLAAVLQAEGEVITADDLELAGEQTASPIGFTLKCGEEEKDRILRALKQADGNKKLAAKLLGIGRTTLYNKMEEYGIDEA